MSRCETLKKCLLPRGLLDFFWAQMTDENMFLFLVHLSHRQTTSP